MIYTVGNKAMYDSLLQEKPVNKIGIRDDYKGGCVFKTAEEARRKCLKEYDVYGLDANWSDTYWCEEEQYQALSIDRPIVKL